MLRLPAFTRLFIGVVVVMLLHYNNGNDANIGCFGGKIAGGG